MLAIHRGIDLVCRLYTVQPRVRNVVIKVHVSFIHGVSTRPGVFRGTVNACRGGPRRLHGCGEGVLALDNAHMRQEGRLTRFTGVFLGYDLLQMR